MRSGGAAGCRLDAEEHQDTGSSLRGGRGSSCRARQVEKQSSWSLVESASASGSSGEDDGMGMDAPSARRPGEDRHGRGCPLRAGAGRIRSGEAWRAQQRGGGDLELPCSLRGRPAAYGGGGGAVDPPCPPPPRARRGRGGLRGERHVGGGLHGVELLLLAAARRSCCCCSRRGCFSISLPLDFNQGFVLVVFDLCFDFVGFKLDLRLDSSSFFSFLLS
nr:unnamed protein product [Digitaria exilis]